jgi:hypothetical protein
MSATPKFATYLKYHQYYSVLIPRNWSDLHVVHMTEKTLACFHGLSNYHKTKKAIKINKTSNTRFNRFKESYFFAAQSNRCLPEQSCQTVHRSDEFCNSRCISRVSASLSRNYDDSECLYPPAFQQFRSHPKTVTRPISVSASHLLFLCVLYSSHLISALHLSLLSL